jgi:hypothetical protein
MREMGCVTCGEKYHICTFGVYCDVDDSAVVKPAKRVRLFDASSLGCKLRDFIHGFQCQCRLSAKSKCVSLHMILYQ